MLESRRAGFEPMSDLHLGKTAVTEDALKVAIAELGQEITRDYSGRPPLLVGVLKGAFMFMADLARAIKLPVEFDFMAVSSYGSATKSSGVVRIVKDLDLDLSARNPASLEVCALLVKEGLQRIDPDIKYVGFTIPPNFVVGYGLDVEQRH